MLQKSLSKVKSARRCFLASAIIWESVVPAGACATSWPCRARKGASAQGKFSSSKSLMFAEFNYFTGSADISGILQSRFYMAGGKLWIIVFAGNFIGGYSLR